MNQEMKEMKEVMMFAMIDKPLASERLKAINMMYSQNKADDKVIETLLYTLNTDPDANVRLVAVETLLAYANRDDVQQGLIKSIEIQESPLLQVALVDGLVAINNKQAIPVFQKLLGKNNLNEVVKEKLQLGVDQLI